MSEPATREDFTIGDSCVAPGERRLVHLPMSMLSNRTPMSLPVMVIHGTEPGPTLFVSAAIHGDELSGVSICRRLLASKALAVRAGTLLMAPIVNAFGFISHNRYLPDRRDLNRSFPGSPGGSLAAQLAHLFLNQVVLRSTCGIDLHSAAIHRKNLPQIRVDARDPDALELATAFGAPIIVDSSLREGSLREAAQQRGVPVIVYEGGEGLRSGEFAVRVGIQGVLRVMAHLGLVDRGSVKPPPRPVLSSRTSWVRAEESGIFRPFRKVGAHVSAGERLCIVADPFGERETEHHAPAPGIVIGRAMIPAVNQGDALYHVAEVDDARHLGERYDQLEVHLRREPLFDEDEIL